MLTWSEFYNQFSIQLNEQQQSAVQSVTGPVLLLAVPGSGKTTVLVTRLGYMIFCRGIAPEKILTVTYTVAATKDMSERFASRFGQDLADRLEICRKHTPAYDTLFAFYHSLASTLAGKADLGVRLKKAYDAHDLSTLETICEEVIPGIINDLSTTRLLREHLWMQDAKPFGYELVDIKLSGVIARLTSTRYRLRYYIDGRVKRLEELEAHRLPYFLPGTPKRENLWHRIISGADLMDTI